MSQTSDRNTDIEQTLKNIKAYQRQGDYQAAADYGDQLPSKLKAIPKIALERSRIKMRQGHMKQTEEILDGIASASPGEQLIVCMEKASLKIVMQLAITQALKDAAAALETFTKAASPVELAEAQRVYSRVLLNAAIYKEITTEEAQAQAVKLPQIAEILESAGYLEESLSARYTYADTLPNETQRQEALIEVATKAEQANCPQVVGEVYTRRAERLLAMGGSTNSINTELEKASTAYEQAQHIIGPIDIRRVRAHLAIKRELSSPDAWIDR